MRKTRLILASMIFSLTIPFSAMAEPETELQEISEVEMSEESERIPDSDETETEVESDQSEEIDEEYIPSHADDENTSQTVLAAPDNIDGSYGGYATYDEYVKSRHQESLSAEQEANGYQLIDGIVYRPGEYYGDNSDSYIGGVMPSDKTGYVSITFNVPAGMHGDVNAGFMSLDNFKTYTQLFYEYNDYKNSITLPDGTYTIEFASKVGDTEGKYFSNHASFEVKVGQKNEYVFDLLSNETSEKETGYNPEYDGDVNISASIGAIESERASEAESKAQKIEAEKKAESKGSVLRLIMYIIFMGVPMAGAIALYIKSKKNHRGFYD